MTCGKGILWVQVFMAFNWVLSAHADPASLCAEISSNLRSGDIIFEEIPNSLMEKVGELTGSWTNHVGVSFQEPSGEWLVYESKIPSVQSTALCKFIKRSRDERIVVRRLPAALDAQAVERIRQAADALMGVGYDFGFDYRSENEFCSKFVRHVFEHGMGLELGAVQTFQEIHEQNPEVDDTFWKWYFLGSIPWDRETITPRSVLEDPQLITVFQNGLPATSN